MHVYLYSNKLQNLNLLRLKSNEKWLFLPFLFVFWQMFLQIRVNQIKRRETLTKINRIFICFFFLAWKERVRLGNNEITPQRTGKKFAANQSRCKYKLMSAVVNTIDLTCKIQYKMYSLTNTLAVYHTGNFIIAQQR